MRANAGLYLRMGSSAGAEQACSPMTHRFQTRALGVGVKSFSGGALSARSGWVWTHWEMATRAHLHVQVRLIALEVLGGGSQQRGQRLALLQSRGVHLPVARHERRACVHRRRPVVSKSFSMPWYPRAFLTRWSREKQLDGDVCPNGGSSRTGAAATHTARPRACAYRTEMGWWNASY